MEWYIWAIWIAFGGIMSITGLLYAYYLLRVEHWLDRYKSRDWLRYD